MTRALLVLALLLGGVAHADIPPGSPPPSIELVTMGRGPSLFEAFGHAALCVRYFDETQSACFNYGVTNYEEAGALIWNFVRGTQVFWSEADNYSFMIEAYRDADRDIWVQVIPTTPAQAFAIADRLWREADREHREYIYDHISNNCATRLRDVLDEELGHPLRGARGEPTSITTRAVAARGFGNATFVVALTDFVLGRVMEQPMDRWEAMFLPDVLRAEVEARLGSVPGRIHTRGGPAFAPSPSPLGRIVFLAVTIAFVLPLVLGRFVATRRRLVLAALPLVAWGVVLWALVAISPIPFVRWNEAVIVFVPLDAMLPFVSEKLRTRWAQLRVVTLLLVALLGAVDVLHQPLWLPIATAVVPLLAISVSRAARDPDRSTDADTASS